jgi:hypothetical protein
MEDREMTTWTTKEALKITRNLLRDKKKKIIYYPTRGTIGPAAVLAIDFLKYKGWTVK